MKSAGIVVNTVGPREMQTVLELPGEVKADDTRIAHDDDIDDDYDVDDDGASHTEGEPGAEGDCLKGGMEDAISVAHRQRHAITGRGVTLAMLMADGVIQSGQDAMSIDYLVGFVH